MSKGQIQGQTQTQEGKNRLEQIKSTGEDLNPKGKKKFQKESTSNQRSQGKKPSKETNWSRHRFAAEPRFMAANTRVMAPPATAWRAALGSFSTFRRRNSATFWMPPWA